MFDLSPDGRIRNLSAILPGLVTVVTERGRVPMRLDNFFPFEDLFSTWQPPRIVHRSSRQIGKTYSLLARTAVECGLVAGTRVIVTTPLQEQSDALSSTIFRPMVDESPIRHLLSDTGSLGNVRMRQFKNGSLVWFSYAHGDTLRVRSKTGRIWLADEAQSMDPADAPVISSCLRAASQPQTWISGTSLTKDTWLELEWMESSQGIWHIECPHCSFENICAIEAEGGHLISMIGPWHADISERTPGVVCHRCQKPISPRFGRWVHRYPERLRDFVGYYAPQIIFPIHYALPNKWKELVGFMRGAGGYSTAKFYNECLGEAYDVAYKLVSIEDLKKAARLGPNTESEAARLARYYSIVVIGVDWGGGGDDGVSRTKGAAIGLAPDGVADVFFGFGFPPSTDRVAEAREILRIAQLCNARLIAHDFGGGIGTASEAALTHLGIDIDRLVPIKYTGVDTVDARPVFHQPGSEATRGYYTMHKSKSLQFLCNAIRYGKVRFFEYDHKGKDEPGHLHDFLSLVEDKIDTPTGGTYRIRRSSKTVCDDFSSAVNYGINTLWEYTQSYPNLVTAGTVSGLY